MSNRLALWASTKGTRLIALTVKAGSFVFGVLILRHEAFQVKQVEPLLIFLGLWLCGVPPATFFDSLRRVGQSVDEHFTGSVHDIPDDEELPPPPRRRRTDPRPHRRKTDDA